MNTKLAASALSLSIAFSLFNPAFATEQAIEEGREVYAEQNAGVGIGFILGAAVGGPIGAIAASLIGNNVGESIGEGKADKQEIAALRSSLAASNTEIANAKHQQRLSQQRLYAVQQQFVDKQLQYEQQMAMMAQRIATDKSLEVSLQFRTGSSDIEPVYQQQLIELAKTMQQMQQYGLDLSGYADRQGEEKYNQQLSLQRANKVKEFLIRQGIDASRIATAAYGESQPLQATQTLQSDFFDRRVMLKLSPKSQSVASNY